MKQILQKFRSIRMRMIMLCMVLLLIPCLIIGLVSYHETKSRLTDSGKMQLKNDVQLVLEMIEALDIQVKSGKVSLEEAQEQVKQQILGKKDANGHRPINRKIDLGQYGYIFIYDQKGNALAHPLNEGKNLWDSRSPDGILVQQELVKQAIGGGGFTSFEWELPNDPNETAPKITYSNLDPNWGWVVCAGTYLSDFNKGADGIFYILVVTLLGASIIGSIITFLYAGRLTKPIELMVTHVQQIADGDLREDLPIRTKDEVGQLASSLNHMVGQFRQLIGGIIQSSMNVAAASQQISASTEEIAGGSSEQARASQTITDLFKELNIAIYNVARNAEKAAELANDTARTAQAGGQEVAVSIEGMNKIKEQMGLLEQDSNKIGEIIEVIDDISDQTNLLALNAAIEAARAGEQGRGFAVVADEVRKLAERSGEATKQITRIIKGMQNNTKVSVSSVADGVEKSLQTGKAFEKIISMVNESADKVSEIAAAGEQQSAQTEEVLRSIESIAAASGEAAAAAEQTASTSQSLAQLAEEFEPFRVPI
ncbi:methyl-accepting chemotaxis protein [Paenibacillus puerhi]|uniref:methyl-accepting chemotaxis protein n=1 Tax=Paenibacillus puerhi TaxID=2692622 RepID=UPI0013597F7F|nr:methyl-accepting chemotaxis protein [Paenibacillus puerhi]